MPRDLFGSVTDPSARRHVRKWPTVLLSFVAHACALLMLLVIPLMATGALPIPKSGATFIAVHPPTLPSPPPAPRPATLTPVANAATAPIEAPAGIAPEPEVDAGFETPGDTSGLVAGLSSDGIDTHIVAPPPPPKPVPQAPVHVGGVIKAPAKTHDVPPVYPAIAIAARVEGVVIVEATIGADGRVQDARVLRSVPLLDQAALDAVRQWAYTPTTLNGVAVPVVMTVTVRFQLQK